MSGNYARPSDVYEWVESTPLRSPISEGRDATRENRANMSAVKDE